MKVGGSAVPSLIIVMIAVSLYPSPTNGQFDNLANWEAYDPGAAGLGVDLDGYSDATFDGRYVYFAPFHNGAEFHGEVLRFDTQGSFADISSWSAFDPGSHGVGQDPDGYMGNVYDGRYIYFVPLHNGSAFHGEILRYDSTADFLDASSWTTYDAGANGVGSDPDGFNGGAFDGRYIYFAPFHNGTENHGEVLRLDTQSEFGAATSWTTYDPATEGIGTNPVGFRGAVYDGKYVYFVPGERGAGGIAHGEVLRYDTTADFQTAAAWAAFDPGNQGIGSDPDGFAGAAFDGRYVYFSPLHNGTTMSAEVLRLDTSGVFTNTNSWAACDPGAQGLGVDPAGYAGALFDGRYVYFVPHYDSVSNRDEVLRLDTTGNFSNAAAWSVCDPVVSAPDGRLGGVFDGRYVYFAPYNEPPHGEVLRYDTLVDCNENGIQDECDIDCGSPGGWCDVPGCGEGTDFNANGVPDDCEASIPAVSVWGLVVLALLVLTGGTIVSTCLGKGVCKNAAIG